MFVFRAIQDSDFNAFVQLAYSAQIGLTSLPKNKELLAIRMDKALESFGRDIWAPTNERYLFVIENTEDKKLGGVSGIDAKTGVNTPSYYYRLSNEEVSKVKYKELSPIPQQILSIVNYQQGPSENVSLFLHRDYRKAGLGKLLSLSRLLFIASNRQRFEDIICASLRGVIIDNSSPFWESLGRHFYDVNYEAAELIRQECPDFLQHIFPKYPIYVSLLPPDVQNIIGIPHPNSVPAYKMLTNLSFKYTLEIDPFDGGPKVSAQVDKVPFIHYSKLAKVEKLKNIENENHKAILCNNRCQNFRAVFGTVHRLTSGGISISRQAAEALHIDIGDNIRYSMINQD